MKGIVLRELLQVMNTVTKAVSYEFVLEDEDGRELRLPVPQETAKIFIGWLCAPDEAGQEKEAEAEDDEESFTQEEAEPEEFEDEEEEGTVFPSFIPPRDRVRAEEDVPPL